MADRRTSSPPACPGHPAKTWTTQDAKARFGELLDTALAEGPQIVTRRGKEEAVLVPIEQWRELETRAQPSLKDLLLSDEARADELVPPRRRWRRREPPQFD